MKPRPQGRAPDEDATIVASVRLPKSLWKAARIRAVDEDRTASEVVQDALERYLDQNKTR
jgi:hypothetical protein